MGFDTIKSGDIVVEFVCNGDKSYIKYYVRCA